MDVLSQGSCYSAKRKLTWIGWLIRSGSFRISSRMSAAVMGLGKGHVIVDHLDMLHVIKCKPKMVTVQETQTCYQDLPVWQDGQPMFRDGKSQTLKNSSWVIDCQAHCSHHKLWGNFYTACPHIERYQGNMTVETIVPETFEEDVFEPKFYSLTTPYEGSAVENALLVIFLSTKRQTMSNRWINDLQKAMDKAEENGSPHGTVMETLTSVFNLMKDGAESTKRFLLQVLNIIVYGGIAIGDLIFGLWICGLLHACICPGDDSPTLMRVFLLPLALIWNGIKAWMQMVGLPT